MTRDNKLIKYYPKPKSFFYLVECPQCQNKQLVFSHASTKVYCLLCGALLAEPTGGKAIIHGKILKKYYE